MLRSWPAFPSPDPSPGLDLLIREERGRLQRRRTKCSLPVRLYAVRGLSGPRSGLRVARTPARPAGPRASRESAVSSSGPSDWNRAVIEEFRANAGRVGGTFAGNPMVLLHHIGARSGTERISPLVYAPDGQDLDAL